MRRCPSGWRDRAVRLPQDAVSVREVEYLDLMGDRVHRSWWHGESPYRRHRPRSGRVGGKCIQRGLLGIWWIFGSITNQRGVRSPWPTPFVAAQVSGTSGDYNVTCNGNQQPRPGAIYSAVGHLNYGVGLDLKADISIPGACEVNLPIEVSLMAPCALWRNAHH